MAGDRGLCKHICDKGMNKIGSWLHLALSVMRERGCNNWIIRE